MIYDPTKFVLLTIEEAEPLMNFEDFNDNAVLEEVDSSSCEESGTYLIKKEWYENHIQV